MAEEQLQLEAQRSLIRVQTFRPESLVRREELGNTFAFDAAVDPAKKLISLFQKIPSEALDIFDAFLPANVVNFGNSFS